MSENSHFKSLEKMLGMSCKDGIALMQHCMTRLRRQRGNLLFGLIVCFCFLFLLLWYWATVRHSRHVP